MSTTLLDVPTEHYIGGERVASAARFETINPYTQEVIAEVSRAGGAEGDRAVRAAHDAFPAWAALGAAGGGARPHPPGRPLDANRRPGRPRPAARAGRGLRAPRPAGGPPRRP